MIQATIMIDEYVNAIEIDDFIKHLRRSFEIVEWVSKDRVILVESKKTMNKDVFIQHCSGFERFIDAVSVNQIDTGKGDYWDDLGESIGFVTADKLL